VGTVGMVAWLGVLKIRKFQRNLKFFFVKCAICCQVVVEHGKRETKGRERQNRRKDRKELKNKICCRFCFTFSGDEVCFFLTNLQFEIFTGKAEDTTSSGSPGLEDCGAYFTGWLSFCASSQLLLFTQ